MADLVPLIRLHKWRIDEKRRALSEIEAYRDGVLAERTRLQSALEHEIALAGEADQLPVGYLAYVKGANQRLAKLSESLAQIDRRVDAARQALAIEFQELKKYETADARRRERAAEALKKAETAAYDEIGLIRHERQRRNPPA